MLKNSSIATIEAPEFIEVTPCNELISQCEIKVCYLGENRNRSFITKETAKQMANTLPGVPIVAVYRQEIDDFGDHGHVITIENGEVKFTCNTVPYGFVAPDAKVWFQKFMDTDEMGNQVEREYMMTTGYLWTGQYPEIQKAIDEGLPQSMELSQDMTGHWATNNNSGIDFFIINDATFTKLCILGSDVEPCFEGASVTAPSISKEYAAEPEFVKKLLEMRKELNYALQNKGGSDMPNENEEVVVEPEATEFTAEEAPEVPATDFEESADGGADAAEGATESESADEATGESEETTPEATEEPAAEETAPETEEQVLPSTDVSSKKKIEFKKEDEEEEEKKEDSEASDAEGSEEKEDEEKKPSKDHSLEEVEAKFAETTAELEFVKSQLADANAELESLRAFKLGIENQRKDAEIAKYHMLSNEDKAEIIAHKSEYSLEEIKSKLAVLYVEKNVDFSTLTGEKEEIETEESPITTFSLDTAAETTFVSSMVQSLLDAREN